MKKRELLTRLNALRQSHYECDDPWYSCPKSGECANDFLTDGECDCGADAFNLKIDELIADLGLINLQ